MHIGGTRIVAWCINICTAQMYFHVHVNGTTIVPARIHGVEHSHAASISQLDTTKKRQVVPLCTLLVQTRLHEVRIDTRRITVPDSDSCIGDRCTGVDIHYYDLQTKSNTSSIFSVKERWRAWLKLSETWRGDAGSYETFCRMSDVFQ